MNACNCNYGMDARKWMHWIIMNVWKWMHGIANMDWMYGNECISLKLCKVCNFKFDCEWGNGMGPQGLGMVPWESPSGILSPTVPWVQW